jgi:hypothetical protein
MGRDCCSATAWLGVDGTRNLVVDVARQRGRLLWLAGHAVVMMMRRRRRCDKVSLGQGLQIDEV